MTLALYIIGLAMAVTLIGIGYVLDAIRMELRWMRQHFESESFKEKSK